MATLQSANASEESDDANEDGAESENEVNDESLIATVQSANALEEAASSSLAVPAFFSSPLQRIFHTNITATTLTPDDADDFEQMAASDEESDAERKGITQDTSGISIDSQPGLTSQANLNGFAATFRGQKQFPEETVMSTAAVELKAVGWENSQLPGMLISSGVVAHSDEIWIVLFGKCLTILFLNI
ncbi:uncharacterized protein LOC141884290 isoform X3 [Acropora palmata]